MKEEKDMRRLSIREASLPFIIGIIAGCVLGKYALEHNDWGYFQVATFISIALTAIFAIRLLLSRNIKPKHTIGLVTSWEKFLIFFIMMFFSLGFFCGSSASLEPGDIFARKYSFEKVLLNYANIARTKIDEIGFNSENTAPLLKALLTGDKSFLNKETISAFRESGASHILALSGLHLGIIYIILSKLTIILGRFRWSKIIRCLLIVTFSGCYVIATGASPSIVRAFLFIFFIETMKLTHRKIEPLNLLCAAIVIQLAFKPMVVKSLGFQLSYLAIAGIHTIFPTMRSWYPEGGLLKKIWDASALSISCQTFTAPLIWYKFHTFPKYFILTNLIALPLVSITMISSISVVFLHWCFNYAPTFLIKICDILASTLITCLTIIANI